MPRSGWAREPWPLSLRVRSLRVRSLRVQSLCSAAGEATAGRGPRNKKKTKQKNPLVIDYDDGCTTL